MAKCDEGYLCEVCHDEVENITHSDLYLRYVIGELDPELLHITPERHIRCNPVLAQFIDEPEFHELKVEPGFEKQHLDAVYVQQRTTLVTRGYKRLAELVGKELAITDYPLPEFRNKFSDDPNLK